jgi:hypothetical protein
MHKRHNRSVAALIAIVIATGCANTPGTGSATAVPSGNLELRATGSGNWDVECIAVTKRGQAISDLEGRGSTSSDTLLVRDVRSAACTYKTGDSPVTLKLMEEGLLCPFGAFDHGLCQTVLPANASGTFEFSPE